MFFESVVVVVDCFFYEGIKVIFQLVLVVLDVNVDKLLNCKDDGEVMIVLGRYLDSVINKDSILFFIFYFYFLFSDDVEFYFEVDIFRFIRIFYEKFGIIWVDLIEQMRFKQRLKVIQILEDIMKCNVV